jgi:hypothetical protein
MAVAITRGRRRGARADRIRDALGDTASEGSLDRIIRPRGNRRNVVASPHRSPSRNVACPESIIRHCLHALAVEPFPAEDSSRCRPRIFCTLPGLTKRGQENWHSRRLVAIALASAFTLCVPAARDMGRLQAVESRRRCLRGLLVHKALHLSRRDRGDEPGDDGLQEVRSSPAITAYGWAFRKSFNDWFTSVFSSIVARTCCIPIHPAAMRAS